MVSAILLVFAEFELALGARPSDEDASTGISPLVGLQPSPFARSVPQVDVASASRALALPPAVDFVVREALAFTVPLGVNSTVPHSRGSNAELAEQAAAAAARPLADSMRTDRKWLNLVTDTGIGPLVEQQLDPPARSVLQTLAAKASQSEALPHARDRAAIAKAMTFTGPGPGDAEAGVAKLHDKSLDTVQRVNVAGDAAELSKKTYQEYDVTVNEAKRTIRELADTSKLETVFEASSKDAYQALEEQGKHVKQASQDLKDAMDANPLPLHAPAA